LAATKATGSAAHGRQGAEAAGDRGIRRFIPLDLRAPLSRLGALDGFYIVVENMPTGARLSAGRCNGDLSWSLAPDELAGLQLILPDGAHRPFALTIRILTPDPQGYDFASTLAKFELFGATDGEPPTIPTVGQPVQGYGTDWPQMVRQAYARHQASHDQRKHGRGERGADTPRTPVDRSLPPGAAPTDRPHIEEQRISDEARIAALCAEWRAEEELRLARARADWEAEWRENWRARELELGTRHALALAAAEASWRARQGTLVASLEAQCSARLATAELRWRSGAKEHHAAEAGELTARPSHRRQRAAYAVLLVGLAMSAYWVL
jgi:hypothetical protein